MLQKVTEHLPKIPEHLNILYAYMNKGFVTNKEIRRKIQTVIGEYDELLTQVQKQKLKWFGHISRLCGFST